MNKKHDHLTTSAGVSTEYHLNKELYYQEVLKYLDNSGLYTIICTSKRFRKVVLEATTELKIRLQSGEYSLKRNARLVNNSLKRSSGGGDLACSHGSRSKRSKNNNPQSCDVS